ncbi:cell division protein ZipA [Marinobacterium lutimaris]|uniref:Cell division protein ZipA n=1 Tax=Marinobacterium lutimaris TaxID=568106 RepID=A0A1H6BB93_9GAMM|nr:cell division protein ZipA [Marinobacterium lutimaris]SEG57824.1 cell division protein ZipA [Marinobacterium lutimaris]
MEISLREWLIIGGILVIALILFDGWRRIRGNRSRIRMNIDRSMQHEDEGEESPQSNPELPNGGARKIAAEAASQRKAEPKERREPSFGAGFDTDLDTGARSEPVSAESDRIPDWPEPEIEPEPMPEPRAKSWAEPKPSSRSQSAQQQDLLAENEPELDPLFDDVPVDRDRAPRRAYSEAETRVDTVGKWDEQDQWDEIDGQEADSTPEPDSSQADTPLTAKRDEDSYSEPEPLSLDFDPEQPIPVLMDRVRPRHDSESAAASQRKTAQEPVAQRSEQPVVQKVEDSSRLGSALDEDAYESVDEHEMAAHRAAESVSDLSDSVEPEQARVEPAADEKEPKARAADSDKKRPAPEITADPEEMLVIFVVARQGETLPGKAIHRIAEACGMEIGAMEIYHRHENPNAQGSLQFSMANAIQPGTFDLDSIDELETPAVTFFMSMRDPADPMYAYECMLATAETLARHLEAEMLDGDRSVMRPQTKEHYRERIRDFEIHKRVRRAH